MKSQKSIDLIQYTSSIFGMPLWVGIMCGRKEKIKFIYPEKINYSQSKIEEFSRKYFKMQIIDIIKTVEKITNGKAIYRVCIDLDLRNNKGTDRLSST